MSVVSLQDFKHFLQIDETDTSRDAYLQDVLDRAESRVSAYLNTKLYASGATPEDITEQHLVDSGVILPRYRPIIQVKSASVSGVTLVENTDFFVFSNYILLSQNVVLPLTPKTLTLVYTAGYVGIPGAIVTAILLTAGYYVKVNSELQPGQQADYRMPDEAKNILDDFGGVAI